MRQEEHINPAILVWARESAGLNVEDAAKRLALGDTKSETGGQRLLELEQGHRRPTRAQLSKIAKTYRRPLLAFYMAAPPNKSSRGEDFRSTGAEVSERENALLDALLRDIKARQEMVRDILEDLDEADRKDFVASASLTEGAGVVAKLISDALRIPERRTDWGKTPAEFFKQLRTATEALGVFVLLVGDLGSYHSALSEDVFRGFALADSVAPFIVINDHDARTARSFTLVHELVHIYLGRSGVSGAPESIRQNTEEGRIEQFCNDVAGRVLLPESFAPHKPAALASGDQPTVAKYIEDVAKQWMVSEPLVAFRLRRLGWISGTLYRDLSASYAARWMTFKENTRLANREKAGGPSYYVLKQSRLGDFLMGVVRRTVRESQLTHTKAAKVLGVSPSSVEPLLRQFEKSPPSLAREGGTIRVLYLLDANVMIRAHEDYYPIDRIPQFWTWLASLGENGTVKVPYEIYQEIAVSTGPLHDWLTDTVISEAMLLDMTTDPNHLNQVLTGGYAPGLNDSEIEEIGQDPFLIAYALVNPARQPSLRKKFRPPASRERTAEFPMYVGHLASAA